MSLYVAILKPVQRRALPERPRLMSAFDIQGALEDITNAPAQCSDTSDFIIDAFLKLDPNLQFQILHQVPESYLNNYMTHNYNIHANNSNMKEMEKIIMNFQKEFPTQNTYLNVIALNRETFQGKRSYTWEKCQRSLHAKLIDVFQNDRNKICAFGWENETINDILMYKDPTYCSSPAPEGMEPFNEKFYLPDFKMQLKLPEAGLNEPFFTHTTRGDNYTLMNDYFYLLTTQVRSILDVLTLVCFIELTESTENITYALLNYVYDSFTEPKGNVELPKGAFKFKKNMINKMKEHVQVILDFKHQMYNFYNDSEENAQKWMMGRRHIFYLTSYFNELDPTYGVYGRRTWSEFVQHSGMNGYVPQVEEDEFEEA